MGSVPSWAMFRSPRAGIIPTKPAARAIVPVATAVVWTTTFSWGVIEEAKARESRKPMRADCKDILQQRPRSK